MKPQAKQCDECRHSGWDSVKGTVTCAKGHKPRFYQPRHMGDELWGWKRRCDEFEERKP
jgi:hypothetical protein